MSRSGAALLCLAILLGGCDTLFGGFRAPAKVLSRPSRSSSVALSDDDTVAVMVNPEDGSVSSFDVTKTPVVRLARVPTGAEPWAVVMHPDSTTAFVANRADHTVVRILNIHTNKPQVSAPVQVGSEPTGLALSPSGARLFVAEFAEGSVSVIDTESMQVTGVIPDVPAPRTLAVTNNGDLNDDDELLVVPQYFGVPSAEASDTGRAGRVLLFSLRDLSQAGAIGLQPLSATGTAQTAAPNQLAGIAIVGSRIYLPGLAVAPAGPMLSLHPALHVADLAAKAEVPGAGGSFSLRNAVQLDTPTDPGRLLMADPVDIDFVPSKPTVGYVLSRGTDLLLRVVFGSTISVGSTQNHRIDLDLIPAQQCQAPTGLVVARTTQRAFVNCWLSRSLGVIDLMGQQIAQVLQSTDALDTSDAASGRIAFHSARGRWSSLGKVACASCHPDGLSDGITWALAGSSPFGPSLRQTPSLTGVFSHGTVSGAGQQQRVLGWTGNADEVHDFEAFARDLSGGLGGITSAPTGQCGGLIVPGAAEQALGLPAPLGPPTRLLQPQAGQERCVTAWDQIVAYLKGLRPPRGLRRLDQASVQRGAALFGAGGSGGACSKCHGGAGWTVSHLFFTPSGTENTRLAGSATFSRPAAWPMNYTSQSTFQIAPEAGPGSPSPIPEVACAIRAVGTFGAVLAEPIGSEGGGGYTVPSLYGLALSAPYLHHGQARTLLDLLSSGSFSGHTQAGAANFGPTGQDLTDLVNFLLSIDATTVEQPVPAGFDAGCAS